jgi:hypothetical protein
MISTGALEVIQASEEAAFFINPFYTATIRITTDELLLSQLYYMIDKWVEIEI